MVLEQGIPDPTCGGDDSEDGHCKWGWDSHWCIGECRTAYPDDGVRGTNTRAEDVKKSDLEKLSVDELKVLDRLI
jgi:hypothetical protein